MTKLKHRHCSENKGLFLDRDGVINEDFGYVHSVDKLEYCNNIFELVKIFKGYGYKIIIVTNQSGIARGLFSEAQFEDFMTIIMKKFESENASIDKYYYCPYHEGSKLKKYKKNSFLRKPGPGMILKGISAFDLNPQKSIIIGDNISDILAGHRAKLSLSILLNKKRKLFDSTILKKSFLEFTTIKDITGWAKLYLKS